MYGVWAQEVNHCHILTLDLHWYKPLFVRFALGIFIVLGVA